MIYIFFFIIFSCISPDLYSQNTLHGEEIIAKSIQYHDPSGQWAKFSHTLILQEIRPNGTKRDVAVTLDRPGGRFIYDMKDGEAHVYKSLNKNECYATLNGSTNFSEEEAQKYRLSCDRIKWYRNYYLFLYGLPMKLKDPGTILDPMVKQTRFQGQDVLSVKVTYELEVGKDTWYFYFALDTYRLAGCRFYHDESKNDGEYIILDDEYRLGDMRIPESRKWYTNEKDKFLGKDILKSHREVD